MNEQSQGRVHVVDDEPGVCATIAAMLQSGGFSTCEYEGAGELLEVIADFEPGCVVSDVNMPGMNGIDLVKALKARDIKQPVIIISGAADVQMAVTAMKAGAIEFLEKPIEPEDLQAAVRSAMGATVEPRSPEGEAYAALVASLTRRQRDVLDGMLEGLPNKLIAYKLGISIRTVEGYRAGIMTRTRAKSLSELVRLSVLAGL